MVFPKEQIKSTWKESFVEVGENKYYRGDEVTPQHEQNRWDLWCREKSDLVVWHSAPGLAVRISAAWDGYHHCQQFEGHDLWRDGRASAAICCCWWILNKKHGRCLKVIKSNGLQCCGTFPLLALGFGMVATVPVLSLFLNSSKVWLSRLRRSLLTPRIDHHVVLVLPKSIKTCRPFLWPPGNLNKTFLKFGLSDWDCLRWSSWKNASITLWSLQESAC